MLLQQRTGTWRTTFNRLQFVRSQQTDAPAVAYSIFYLGHNPYNITVNVFGLYSCNKTPRKAVFQSYCR